MVVFAGNIQLQVATLGNFHSITDRLRYNLEQFRHLVRRLDIELFVGKTHPVRIIHRLAGLDAEKDLMRKSVIAGQIMAIISGNQRQTEFLANLDQPLISHFLL